MSKTQPKGAEPKTDVAVQEGGPVSTDVAADFSGFAGERQALSKDDLAIPFISILQSNSPQVKRSEGAYVEGAQEGFLFNSVTNEVIDPADGFQFVLCAYKRSLVEWRIREKGGGFVAEHEVRPDLQSKTVRDEKNRDILPNGNQLNDTRTFYIMVLDSERGPLPAVIALTSTQIKKSRQLLMQLEMLRLKDAGGKAYSPPMFASKVNANTVPESNEKGSWMGWAWSHAGYFPSASDPEFLVCRKFHKDVTEGLVKADLSRMAEQDVDPDTGEIRNKPGNTSAPNNQTADEGDGAQF